MAQRSVTSFKSTKNSRYTDNTTGLVTALNSRDMFEDSADSFLNKTDGGTVTGNIGIGSAVTPNAPLQFANATVNRKIVLFEDANNDHQFYGFGVDAAGNVRYQSAGVTSTHGHVFYGGSSTTTSTELARITGTGKLGIGLTPTAILHLKAGTAAANTAPFKLTTGTALTTPEDGAIEYHSSHLYFTIGSTRYQLDQQTTASNIASGTFSPTFTSQTNLDVTPTATAGTAKYTRVGDIVTVTMYANVDPTASGSYSFLASLPIASNFTASTDLLGLGATASADGHRCEVIADTVGDRALINGTSTGTAVQSLYITYTYKIM